MERVRQCPYKPVFLLFFRICTFKKLHFQIQGNFVLIDNSR
jgi:hypothetical protein